MTLPIQPLSEIGHAILAHVGRYRMSTASTVLRLPELQHHGPEKIRRELQRLYHAGQLVSAPLFHHRRYYYLVSGNGQRTTNQSKHQYRFGPLSEIAKIRNYAILSFCCASQQHRRQRLTNEELGKYLPALDRPGVPLNYYIETDASPLRLGFIRVDIGGRGRWDRILEKARTDIEAHWIEPEIRPLIEQGSFEITVITALPQKALRLTQGLKSWKDTRNLHIRIGACPELINLIAPSPS